MKLSRKSAWVACALMLATVVTPAAGRDVIGDALHSRVAAVANDSIPIALYVLDSRQEESWSLAVGNVASTPLDPEASFRIASNTKTFVAATTLRLWEKGLVDLDAPIGPLIAPRLDEILRADGYRTDKITIRHLLSHSGGLYDHGGDPRFVAFIKDNPGHIWTRDEQIALMVDYADPQSSPGTRFQYSDGGYVLIGDIIERVTKKPLATAVREELGFERLGLNTAWWEIVEQAPSGAKPRVKQYLGDFDGYVVHASMDLFGGGGLIMSVRDLATFMAALFEGKVFEKPETIREMLWQGPHQDSDRYRLGVFVNTVEGREIYSHSGFWGTIVHYRPDTGVTVAAATTQQRGAKSVMFPLVETIGAEYPMIKEAVLNSVQN